jgi:hypothetical protein
MMKQASNTVYSSLSAIHSSLSTTSFCSLATVGFKYKVSSLRLFAATMHPSLLPVKPIPSARPELMWPAQQNLHLCSSQVPVYEESGPRCNGSASGRFAVR